MTSPAEILFARLERVRETSHRCWTAACPGPLHRRGDRNSSLSLKETPKGMVLLHCFAGCEPSDALAPIGLTLSDLYPSSPDLCSESIPVSRRRRYGQAIEAVRALSMECTIIVVAAEQLLAGQVLTEVDRARVHEARHRIVAAMELCA